MRRDVAVGPTFSWVDVVDPDREELLKLAVEFALPPTVVEDCLDPEHLPKHERIGDATFMILRVRDLTSPDDASTIQELTRKVSVFFRNHQLLTVHRVDLQEVSQVRDQFAARSWPNEESPLTAVLAALVNATLDSYERPLERAQDTLDAFEVAVFDGKSPPSLRSAYNLKRRITLSRRILWQTNNVLQKLVPPAERSAPLFQDIRESVDAYLFWNDQLLDEVNQLLQIHVAMASNRASEVMRILTIFSAFFLPLTFIAGVYGMNFSHMPELDQPWGYPVALAIMAGVSIAIFTWFRRRRWL
jgi:magnesium transporter